MIFMLKRKITNNLNGGPALNADVIVRLSSSFDSQIYIEKDLKKINAKSIIGVLSLSLKPGDEITVIASGKDESEAMEALNVIMS